MRTSCAKSPRGKTICSASRVAATATRWDAAKLFTIELKFTAVSLSIRLLYSVANFGAMPNLVNSTGISPDQRGRYLILRFFAMRSSFRALLPDLIDRRPSLLWCLRFRAIQPTANPAAPP